MYLLLRVNKKIKIKENVVFVCFFNKYVKKKKKKIQYLYWTKNTFLMLLMENLHKNGNWNADQME